MVLNDANLKLYTEKGEYICTVGELLDECVKVIFSSINTKEIERDMRELVDKEFEKWYGADDTCKMP